MSYKVWMECYITFVTFGLQGYFITYSDNMCICIIRMYRSNLLHFIPTQTDNRTTKIKKIEQIIKNINNNLGKAESLLASFKTELSLGSIWI
jgi:hypothetical protein